VTDPLIDLHRFLWSNIQTQQQQLAEQQQRIAELEAALTQAQGTGDNGHVKPPIQEQATQ
jgi:hypothetical protein